MPNPTKQTEPLARRARTTTGLTQEAFAEMYGLSVGTLRYWEQGLAKPDRATTTYLLLIEAFPEVVAALVKKLPL
jgi:putative transcriptional regulator